MLLEVSLIVLLPPPYGPPGVLLPGLVTVTATLPAVAMAEAGIATVSWFMAGWAVLVCATPLQFTTALALKLLPLTVNMKPWPPALAVLGTICAITGVIPAFGGQRWESCIRRILTTVVRATT